MWQARFRRKCRRRVSALAFAIAMLATCGFVGPYPISPALSQTPDPIPLSLFDPEIADVRPSGFDEIKNATNCYPTATFYAGVPPGDPEMQESLGKARIAALKPAFKQLVSIWADSNLSRV
jgi:hypothetical protein